MVDLDFYESNGFVIVPNVLTAIEVEKFRDIIKGYMLTTFLPYGLSNNDKPVNSKSKVIPGWSGITPEVGHDLNNLHNDSRIKTIVTQILGHDWIFADHSDMHQDKLSGWHTDVLPPRLSHFQTLNTNDEGYNIIKVSFLLQDHINNPHGLHVIPGSHKKNSSPTLPRHEYAIPSTSADAVIFDQRIKHRGQLTHYIDQFNQHRYLLTFGYGLNNEYTAQHMAGTRFRQLDQRSRMYTSDS